MKILKKTILFFLLMIPLAIAIYYYYPIQKIHEGVVIDKILVLKSEHKLIAYSNGNEVVKYTVAIGKKPVGDKEYEGDLKTPEGKFTIFDKNPNSGWHKNLGISYPNAEDIARAKKMGKHTGGDIKIHGLKKGSGYIGRFHRWEDWTNGCIALMDEEVDELYEHVKIGAEIEIRK